MRVGNPPQPKKHKTKDVTIWEHHTDAPTVELSYRMSQNIKRWNLSFERLVKWMGGVPADVLDKEYANILDHLYVEKGMSKKAIKLLRETGTIYTAGPLIAKYNPRINPIFAVLDFGIFFGPHINKKGELEYEDGCKDWRKSVVKAFMEDGYNMVEQFQDVLKDVSELHLEYRSPGKGQWQRQATYTGSKADNKGEKAFEKEEDDLDTGEFFSEVLGDVARCYILLVLEELGVKAEYLQGHRNVEVNYMDIIKQNREHLLAEGKMPDPKASARYDERNDKDTDSEEEGLEGEEVSDDDHHDSGDSADGESDIDCNCEEDDDD